MSLRLVNLDLMKHGDVAVLKTASVEVAFISGEPVAYRDIRSNALFVSNELDDDRHSWHCEQVAGIWPGRLWTWISCEAVVGALICKREHNPRCAREHEPQCTRQHRCTRPHLRGPRPKPGSGSPVKLLDRGKRSRVGCSR